MDKHKTRGALEESRRAREARAERDHERAERELDKASKAIELVLARASKLGSKPEVTESLFFQWRLLKGALLSEVGRKWDPDFQDAHAQLRAFLTPLCEKMQERLMERFQALFEKPGKESAT